LLLFLLLTAPLAYFAWGGLSHLLAGQWNPGEFALGAGALAVFAGLASVFKRWLGNLPTNQN
jgi:hypothetical protein